VGAPRTAISPGGRIAAIAKSISQVGVFRFSLGETTKRADVTLQSAVSLDETLAMDLQYGALLLTPIDFAFASIGQRNIFTSSTS